LLSIISPFLGLIFVIAYCGRIWAQSTGKQLLYLGLFIIAVSVLAVIENSLLAWLNASDAIVGVGLGTLLFVLLIKQRQDANKALALILVYEIGYSLLRSWLFSPTLHVVSAQMTPTYESYLHRIPNLQVNKEMVTWIQNFMTTYQTAIWGTSQMLAVFLGYLLFNRFSVISFPLRFIRFPHLVIYPMILALALAIYPDTRVWGINFLICMGIIFLIQGSAVLSFAWGDFFSRARFLRTLLIIAIIINYPVLILIALAGLMDFWFDFRKLNKMEEIHESNSH
jgi:hypothetical protein